MIPLKDQNYIRAKFASELVYQVKIDYFSQRDVALDVPGMAPCQFCKPVGELLQELAGLSDLVSLRVHYAEDNPPEKSKFGVERVPGIVLRRGETFVKYYGMPGGTEFPAFIESIVDFSRNETLLSEESVHHRDPVLYKPYGSNQHRCCRRFHRNSARHVHRKFHH